MQIRSPIHPARTLAGHIADRQHKPSQHFWFYVGEQRYVYCYTRKNGCSTFKKFITARSHETFQKADQTQLKFLNKHHKIHNCTELKHDDITLFVYRDPWDRLVSLYVNKFVMHHGNKGISQSYENWTGCNPIIASFSDFITKFCKAPFKTKDPHIRPQAAHLHAIDYSHAIPLHGIYDFACTQFGHDLGQTYFQTPVNTTTAEKMPPLDNAIDLPAQSLNDIFKNTGQLPEKSDFADNNLKERVKKQYACDYRLIANQTAAF